MMRQLLCWGLALCLLCTSAGAKTGKFPSDVKQTGDNKKAVEYVLGNGSMSLNGDKFEPDKSITLGELLEALQTVYQGKNDSLKGSAFSGAKANNSAWTAAQWARNRGVLDDKWLEEHGAKRDSKNKWILNLDEEVAHKDAAVFLWTLHDAPQKNGRVPSVTDIPKKAYYYQAAGWALEREIIPWKSNGKFYPGKAATRLETALLLYKDNTAEKSAKK